MATAGDLITTAFRKVGIPSPTTAQTANALESLNNLVGILGADLIAPSSIREEFTLTAAKSTYTIGSGLDFDTVAPISIINGYVTDDDGYEHSLEVINGTEFNDIPDKTPSRRL